MVLVDLAPYDFAGAQSYPARPVQTARALGHDRNSLGRAAGRAVRGRQFYFWNNVRDFTRSACPAVYSITLSVFTRIAGGTASPSAFAVLRLRINSNLRGVWDR
jgi:hypothetical protein